jgi:hypothetical protein
MFAAAVCTKPVLTQQIKMIVVAALLALSFLVGTAPTTTHVGAEKPTTGQNMQRGRAALQTFSVQLDADQWFFLTGEHTNAGGFYCFKV